VGGLVGLFFIPFSLAMTFGLLASLLVSLTFIPLGLGFIGARSGVRSGSGHRALEWLRHWNERLFRLVARTPRLSLAITFGVLLVSLVALVFVPIDFLPLPNEGVLLESFTLPPGYVVAYAVCFAMSLAYSVPPLRFKAVAGVDWVINMWGFGTVTPYAGWAATGRPLDLMHGLVLLAFCPLFASLYPLTQIYQFEEDEARGDRTLALILGLRLSLVVAIAAMAVAFVIFGVAAILRYAGALQWLGLLVALGAWLWVLVPWYWRRDAMTPHQHQARFYAALTAWAVTDVAVLFAFAV
ncbi:MAG: hypothetical protein B7Z72_06110, partial [Gemmatimonadetes bacterium 21-71-4]